MTEEELNDIGVLKRREIEARIVAPLFERFAQEVGRERAAEIVAEVIIGVAQAQGRQMRETLGAGDLTTYANSTEPWTRGGSLEVEVIEQNDRRYAFNVTRCRYAEMYKELGLAELGAALSCNRDGTLVEGFNPEIEFERTQTIMSGASHCDFVYSLPERPVAIGD